MEKYTFFNDVDDDRIYFAEDFARHLATYFTNGIFNNGCQVLADTNNMAININIGSANINGYRYDNDAIKTLQIDNADGVLNRVDNIVIRLDLTNRNISLQVIKGAFAQSPVAPNLVRTSTIYDLRIAKISIPAGTTEITQDLVEDCRFIKNDCGNVVSTVETIDTTDVYNQLYTKFENLIQKETDEFVNWFTKIKNTVDSDAATSLALDINKIVDNGLKSYEKVLNVDNWVLNSENNLYEYDINDTNIKANTLVNGILDIENQIKINNAMINSYNGGFKISTIEKPIENINITITYQLSNLDLEVV